MLSTSAVKFLFTNRRSLALVRPRPSVFRFNSSTAVWTVFSRTVAVGVAGACVGLCVAFAGVVAGLTHFLRCTVLISFAGAAAATLHDVIFR